MKTRMLLQVHDELIFEVPDEEMETVKNVNSKVSMDFGKSSCTFH